MTCKRFCVCFFDQLTPAGTTTTISSVCSKCGTIAKSGKRSCCGRGGSWFRNCGRAGSAKLRRTWYEGIRTCKTRTQLKTASGQQSHSAQQLNSRDDFGTANSKAVIRDVETFPLALANTSTPIPVINPITMMTTNTIDGTITTMTMIDHTTKEAIVTAWISQGMLYAVYARNNNNVSKFITICTSHFHTLKVSILLLHLDPPLFLMQIHF